MACLCSDDAGYVAHGAAVAAAVGASGGQRCYVAGRAAADEMWPGAGVTHTITASTDVRAALTDLLDHLGVA